jgi:hypothetical protein
MFASVFFKTAMSGTPLGISMAIPPSNGLWPQKDIKSKAGEPLELTCFKDMAHSAEQNADKVWSLFQEDKNRGWVKEIVDTPPVVVTTSLLSKTTSSGTKDRILQDYKSNGVNRRVRLTETISQPGVNDVQKAVQSVMAVAKDNQIATVEIDIASAFRMAPVNEHEQPFLAFRSESDISCIF